MQNMLVELKNVSKSYLLGSTQINALNNISLTIRKGDFFASTTISHIPLSFNILLIKYYPQRRSIYFLETQKN